MDVGVVIPLRTNTLDISRQAERLGFDYLACGEHVYFNEPTFNGFISLSGAAAVTRSIRLMTAVCLLPLYPTGLVAKMAAELDNLSGGRLDLGIGVGGESPKEFDACGVPYVERGARADESLAALDVLLRGGTFSHTGRFASFDGVRLKPPPTQRPRPPIWVAGRKMAALRRAVAYGDGWLPYLCTPQHIRDKKEVLNKVSVDTTGTPWLKRIAPVTFLCLDENEAEARSMALAAVGRWFGQDFSNLGKYVAVGGPSRCLDRLREYRDSGADLLMLSLACPPERVPRMLDLVGEKFLEEIRAWDSARGSTSDVWSIA